MLDLRMAGRVLAGAAVVAAVGFGIVYGQAREVRRRGEALLRGVCALRVGTSTADEVRALRKRFGGTVHGECPRHCMVQIGVDNGALPAVWRGPTARLLVTLVVRDGRVEERTVAAFIGTGAARPMAGVTEKRAAPAGARSPQVHTTWGSGGERWRCVMELDPELGDSERMRYLSFDAGCLSRFRGCQDAQQLLPGVEWGAPPGTN